MALRYAVRPLVVWWNELGLLFPVWLVFLDRLSGIAHIWGEVLILLILLGIALACLVDPVGRRGRRRDADAACG